MPETFQYSEGPPPLDSDLGRESAEVRELRRLKETNLNEAEEEFRKEQRQIEAQKKRMEEGRKKLEQKAHAAAPLMFLLVAKQYGKFRVVGFYSDRDELAGALPDAAVAYAPLDAKLGVVEFDLSIVKNAPALPPLKPEDPV